MSEPSMSERAREGARRWLRNAGIDPADPRATETGYRLAHADHARWLTGERTAVIDAEAWKNLVEAIQIANGWDQIPLGWPAPHFALMAQPLRNTLQRIPKAVSDA